MAAKAIAPDAGWRGGWHWMRIQSDRNQGDSEVGGMRRSPIGESNGFAPPQGRIRSVWAACLLSGVDGSSSSCALVSAIVPACNIQNSSPGVFRGVRRSWKPLENRHRDAGGEPGAPKKILAVYRRDREIGVRLKRSASEGTDGDRNTDAGSPAMFSGFSTASGVQADDPA